MFPCDAPRSGVLARESGDCDRPGIPDWSWCGAEALLAASTAAAAAAVSGWAAGRIKPHPAGCQQSAGRCGWIWIQHTLLRPALLLFALARFLDLITSVLRLIGRGLPCSLRNRPQALQRTKPFSSRRQSGVVLVEQFWQTAYAEN
jgi:hypothetical protein